MPETGTSLRCLGKTSVEAAPTELERYVADRLDGIPGPVWLDGQTFEEAVRGTEMLGGFLTFGPDRNRSNMSVADLHRAGAAGWQITRDGIEGVLPAINAHLGPYVPHRPGRPDERLGLGMLGQWVTSRGRGGNPGALHALVTARALDHLPLDPHRKLLGRQIERPRLVTVSALARGRGYGAGALASSLCHRGVLSDGLAGRRPLEQVVGYEPGLAVCDGMDRVASVGIAALRLGVSASRRLDALDRRPRRSRLPRSPEAAGRAAMEAAALCRCARPAGT